MKSVICIILILALSSLAFPQKTVLVLAGAGQNAGGPKESDDLVIERLEALGYDVEYYYLDDPSKMTEDLGLDKDLVVVSSTVNSAHIGNFYMDKDVPVLTWEQGMYGKLAIASGGGIVTVAEPYLYIIAEGHPAIGAYTGEVDIISEPPQELSLMGSDQLQPGAEIIAEIEDDGGTPLVAIHVVDMDSSLTDGNPAPARRLGFFFRDETAIYATEDALAILDLCSKWTIGDESVSSVEELKSQIASYKLHKNYPNPFNPITNIAFTLAKNENMTLTIYDVLGQSIRTLHTGVITAGHHTLQWDGTNDAGINVNSGVYLVKMTAGQYQESQKIILVK